MVAFAGAASAQSSNVTVTGSAEMGILGGEFRNSMGVVENTDVQFLQSVDVNFALSGTTDNGLSFGAKIDLEDAVDTARDGTDLSNGTNASKFADYTVFISGDWGTLTLGDTDGAMDWALTEAGNMANPGSIGDNETDHAGYLGSYLDSADAAFGDGQVLRYNNTFGAVGVAVSVDQTSATAGKVGDTGYALGLKYNLDLGGTTVALGAGYQQRAIVNTAVSAPTATGVSAVATFSAITAGIVYTSFENDARDSHIGVGLGYETGPISLHANYGEYDMVNGRKRSGFGLAAAYDLGGGASVKFGYGSSDREGVDYSNYSLGVAMSF